MSNIDPELWVLVHGGPFSVAAVPERIPDEIRDAVLDFVTDDGDPTALLVLANNHHEDQVPVRALLRIREKYPCSDAAAGVLGNPNTPTKVLDQAWERGSRVLFEQGNMFWVLGQMGEVAANPNVSDEVYREALNHPARAIHTGALRNPRCSVDDLKHAVEKAAENERSDDLLPNIRLSMLEGLLKDATLDPRIRDFVKSEVEYRREVLDAGGGV